MADYYAAQTALDYKVLLHHFKQQAAGSKKVALLPSYLTTKLGKRNGGSSIVIIDRPKHEITTPSGERMPSMQIVDEAEAGRKRAESELEREDAISEHGTHSSHQSRSGTRQRRTNQATRKRASTNITKGQKVKRARDLFD
jgi:hypothetical protein